MLNAEYKRQWENKLKSCKRSIATISCIAVFWFFHAMSESARNTEYADIVGVVANAELNTQCIISTQIDRNWPFSWAPNSMKVTLKKDGLILESDTSKFFKPNRNKLKSSNTKYHFTWSKDNNNKLEASYIDFEIDRNKKLVNIAIGVCNDYPNDQYFYHYLEQCNTEVSIIKCT